MRWLFSNLSYKSTHRKSYGTRRRRAIASSTPSTLEERIMLAADLTVFSGKFGDAFNSLHQEIVTSPLLDKNLPVIGRNLNASVLNTQLNSIESKIRSVGSGISSTSQLESRFNDVVDSASFKGTLTRLPNSDANPDTEFFRVNLTGSVPTTLAFSLGLPALDFGLNGSVSAALSYDFDFVVGLETVGSSTIFLLDTSGADEFKVHLDVTAPGLTGKVGTLGLLSIKATDRGTFLGGDFVADLESRGSAVIKETNLSRDIKIGGSSFTGQAGVDLHLEANLGTSSAKLGLQAELVVENWTFTDTTPNGTIPNVCLKNVQVDVGTFVKNVIGPTLKKIQPSVQPIRDVAQGLSRKVFPGIENSSLFKEFDQSLPGSESTLKDYLKNLDYLDLIQFGAIFANYNDPSALLSLSELLTSTSSKTAYLDGIVVLDRLFSVIDSSNESGQILLTVADEICFNNDLRSSGASLAFTPKNARNNILDSVKAGNLQFSEFHSVAAGLDTNDGGTTRDGGRGDRGYFRFDIFDNYENIIGLFLGQETQVFSYAIPELQYKYQDSYQVNTGWFAFGVDGGFELSGKLSGGFTITKAGVNGARAGDSNAVVNEGIYIDSTVPVLEIKGLGRSDELLNMKAIGLGGTFTKSIDINREVGNASVFASGKVDAVAGVIIVDGKVFGGLSATVNDPNNDGKATLGEIRSSSALGCLIEIAGNLDYSIEVKSAIEFEGEVSVGGTIGFSAWNPQETYDEFKENPGDAFSGAADQLGKGWNDTVVGPAQKTIDTVNELKEGIKNSGIPFNVELGGEVKINKDGITIYAKAGAETYIQIVEYVPKESGELFSFSTSCATDEGELISNNISPVLAEVVDGTLLLFMGEAYGYRRNIFSSEINESFEVSRISGTPGTVEGESVIVSAFGVSQVFVRKGILRVEAHAGTGNDSIAIDPALQSFVALWGGDGNDFLSSGIGGGFLNGDGDVDVIVGGDSSDLIFGGYGSDFIYGGGGDDRIFGDSAQYTVFDGDDIIVGGSDNDTLTGNGGNDVISGSSGKNTLVEYADANYILSDAYLEGVGTDQLSEIGNAVLTGGASVNTFVVGNWSGVANLYGAGQKDLFVTSFNGFGTSAVNVFDDLVDENVLLSFGTYQADRLTLSQGNVNLINENVNYSGIRSAIVMGIGGVDAITLMNSSETEHYILGGTQNDTVRIGVGYLDSVSTFVFVSGNEGIDKLIFNDRMDSRDNRGRLTAGRLEGLGLSSSGVRFDNTNELVYINLGSGGDDFLVREVLRAANGQTTVNAGGGKDTVSVGSRDEDNDSIEDGNLDAIQTRLFINAETGNDSVFVNDFAKAGLTAYSLSPDRLVKIDDPTAERGAHPALQARPEFAGIYFNGTAEHLTLVGNDEVNLFKVRPSRDTEFAVDGRDPVPLDCTPGGGDFLKLDLGGAPPNDPDPVTGQKITFTKVVDGRQVAGYWSFDPPHLDVNFENIERFNFVDKLVVGKDAGTEFNGDIDVFDAASGRFERRITVFPSASFEVNGQQISAEYIGGVRVFSTDVNCDGIPDIIAVSGKQHRPELKVFNGINGTQIGEAIPLGDASYVHGVSVAAGDLDFDGHTEVVTMLDRVAGPKLVSIYEFNHDQLQFVRSVDSLLDEDLLTGGTLAVGDFNGDDRGEILVGSGPGHSPVVRMFSDYGTLLQTLYPLPQDFRGGVQLSTGEVNDDRYDDILLTTGRDGQSLLYVFDGQAAYNGNLKTLAPVTTFASGASSYQAPGDVVGKDLDGDLDIEIFTSQQSDGRTRAIRGWDVLPNSTLVEVAIPNRLTPGLPTEPWSQSLVGDFDGDGKEDLAVRDLATGNWHVAIAGTGRSESWGRWSTAANWDSVVVGDFNGDGKSDIAGRANGTWWVAISDGHAFTSSPWEKWSDQVAWEDVTAGDFNGDGKTDIAGRANGNWWVAIADQDQFSTSLWAKWSTSPVWKDVLAADFDGDGKTDLAGRANGNWWVATSNGGRFSTSLWTRWSRTANWEDVLTGDFNGDGKADIAGRANGKLWVALSDSGRFENRLWGSWSTSVNWRDVSIGDFNGDGKADIAGRANGNWWVALSDGNRFSTSSWGRWSTSTSWNHVHVADLDGDGRSDLIGQSSNGKAWFSRSEFEEFANSDLQDLLNYSLWANRSQSKLLG